MSSSLSPLLLDLLDFPLLLALLLPFPLLLSLLLPFPDLDLELLDDAGT